MFNAEPEQRGSWSRGAFVAVLCAGIALALFSNIVTSLNTDLGWVLDFGREVVEGGALPSVNGRSFIEPNHPVVMHEWLACLAFFVIHQAWGAPGLLTLKALCSALLIFGVALSLRASTRRTTSALITLLLVASTVTPAVSLLRPQLFAWPLLAFVVFAGLTQKRWALWSCLPLLVLWGNVHGSVLAGVVILCVLCAGLLIESRWNGERLSVRRWELIAVPVLGALATMLNPYGPDLLIHTWHHATDPIRLLNAEWQSLLRAGEWHPMERVAVIAYAVTTLLALLLLPFRRVRLWALLAIAVASGLSAQRHLRMSPVLMAPMVAAVLDALLDRLERRLESFSLERWSIVLASAFAGLFGALWLASSDEAFTLRDRRSMNIGNVLWIMRANGIHGRIWNDFNWGGTLLWSLPESQIACDGRNVTAYSSELLRKNMLFPDEREPLALVTQSGADLIVLPRDAPALKQLRTRYQQLFCDDVVCLLSSNPANLERARAGLRLPSQPVPATAFFALPGRPFLELKPEPPSTATTQPE